MDGYEKIVFQCDGGELVLEADPINIGDLTLWTYNVDIDAYTEIKKENAIEMAKAILKHYGI